MKQNEDDMIIENIRKFIQDKAEEFGAKIDNEFNKPYMERNNTGKEALKDNGAYFGFIHPDEEPAGPFHDFSLTIFPNDQNKPWLVCLGIGSSGFKNDYELATFPGLRRLFSNLINERGFCKSSFSDIETSLPKSITNNSDLSHIKNTIKKYSKVLPVCQIVANPESSEGKEIISAFTAAYAKLREWPTNNNHRSAIQTTLKPFVKKKTINHESNIINLLEERKFIILQGAPGTGKTRLAKLVAETIEAKTFFIQFHAETSYSDFIYGIRPDVKSNTLNYRDRSGVFSEALKHAIDTKEKTILIIDEINRANLSNVLGPIFYLFEHKQDISNVFIEITPNLFVDKLPDNFMVIGTMNTADRSLAVVDFALRRRFAWYTLLPEIIDIDNSETEKFYEEDFIAIDNIFNWYANSSELTLQPGQGYFIASSENEMLNRIKYEIFPLVCEYLQEGLLTNAKEEFNDYFSNRINQSLYL